MNSFTSKLLQIANKAGALCLLNILYIVCCLPLVTIGAACTALYTCIFLMPDSKDGYLVRTFFQVSKRTSGKVPYCGLEPVHYPGFCRLSFSL